MAENKKSSGMNPNVAAALGAAAGLAVGAAAVAMTDPKNRAKVKKVAVNAEKSAVKFAKNIGSKAKDMSNDMMDAAKKAEANYKSK